MFFVWFRPSLFDCFAWFGVTSELAVEGVEEDSEASEVGGGALLLWVAEDSSNWAHTSLLYRLRAIPVPQALTSFNSLSAEPIMMRRNEYLIAAKYALALCAYYGYQ